MPDEISWEDFEKVDVRAGKVLDAGPFPEAHKPTVKLTIDFGLEIGIKKSSAQINTRYVPDELPGRQVVAVVNFPPKAYRRLREPGVGPGGAGRRGRRGSARPGPRGSSGQPDVLMRPAICSRNPRHRLRV